jgi:hypothetical protein
MDLILEGSQLMKENETQQPLIAIEVGAHTAEQTIDAANHGFISHCVEPSPISCAKMKKKLARNQRTLRRESSCIIRQRVIARVALSILQPQEEQVTT